MPAAFASPLREYQHGISPAPSPVPLPCLSPDQPPPPSTTSSLHGASRSPFSRPYPVNLPTSRRVRFSAGSRPFDPPQALLHFISTLPAPERFEHELLLRDVETEHKNHQRLLRQHNLHSPSLSPTSISWCGSAAEIKGLKGKLIKGERTAGERPLQLPASSAASLPGPGMGGRPVGVGGRTQDVGGRPLGASIHFDSLEWAVAAHVTQSIERQRELEEGLPLAAQPECWGDVSPPQGSDSERKWASSTPAWRWHTSSTTAGAAGAQPHQPSSHSSSCGPSPPLAARQEPSPPQAGLEVWVPRGLGQGWAKASLSSSRVSRASFGGSASSGVQLEGVADGGLRPQTAGRAMQATRSGSTPLLQHASTSSTSLLQEDRAGSTSGTAAVTFLDRQQSTRVLGFGSTVQLMKTESRGPVRQEIKH